MSAGNRVALITGGASGIGAATACLLAEQGVRVFAASRRPPESNALLEASVTFIVCDVTDDAAVRSLVEEVRARGGGLNLAVNAAGVEGKLSPLDNYPLDDCRHVLNVNVVGMFLSLKYEIGAMREHGGAIVNIASIAGLKGVPNASAYTASKHAVIGLTRVAALESADVPIRVNAVCPSLVDTAMADRLSKKSGLSKADFAASNPMKRVADASEVARTISWLLSDDASFVSGQVLGVDGAQSAA